MDQFSFQGPFAYRWIDDVPVERIDLRSGERRSIEVGHGGSPPVARPDGAANGSTSSAEPLSDDAGADPSVSETVVRAAMAAWN